MTLQAQQKQRKHLYKVMFHYIKHGSFYLNVYSSLQEAFQFICKEEHALLGSRLPCQLVVFQDQPSQDQPDQDQPDQDQPDQDQDKSISKVNVKDMDKLNIGTIYIPCVYCPMTKALEETIWERLEYSQYVILVE